MNTEQKREYLKQYRFLSAKLRRIKDMICENPERKARYKEQIKATRYLRDKIENEIDNVDGGILSEILAEKYICGKTVEEIAVIIGYCKRQTERLHLKALENFALS